MEKQLSTDKEELLLKREIIPEKSINISETALLSEKSLAKDWLSPEDEEAWKDL